MSPARILAIEDDPIHAEAFKLAVEESGHILIQVLTAIDEFTRMVKATLPDILVFDIDLGEEINGIELARQISKEFDIPFIFLTSHKDIKTAKEASELLPSGYITKPVNSASLVAAVDLARNRKREYAGKASTKNELFIRAKEGYARVEMESLLYIEANNKTCILYFENNQEEVNIKLRALLDQLPADKFIQVHRSFVVNISKIDLIDPSYRHLTTGNYNISIGRNFKDTLLSKILHLK